MKLPRGKTFKVKHNPAKRPPKVSGRVANDVWQPPLRSAVAPPPASDTQEPRGRGLTRGGGKGLTKGGQGGRVR